MRMLAGALLLLCLGALWYFVRNDIADYAAFKLLTETADRQRRYLIWTLRSFAMFAGGTVLCLAILGCLHALIILPAEFDTLSLRAHAYMPKQGLPSTGFLAGFAGTLVVGLVIGTLIAQCYKKTSAQTGSAMLIGDIEPLMPRNWTETACTTLLSVNAGLSEELFFRLFLPLLLTLLTGNAIVAFAVAAIIFGFVHIYQGMIGVVATTFLGLVFTVIYLWTGSIWIAAGAHAGLDLVGLVIRPSIMRAMTSRSA